MTIEIDGYFFLPDEQDRERGGKLVFDPVEGGALSLLGSLDLRQSSARILGRCADGYYTLEDCFVTNNVISGTITTQKIYVGRIYGGVAYDANEVPTFDRVNFGLTNFIEWVQPARIQENWGSERGEDGGSGRWLLNLGTWEKQIIGIDEGSLAIGQTSGIRGDGLRERTLTQNCSVTWRFGRDLSLTDAVDLSSDLQDLVSIGTGRVAAFEYVHLYHRDLAVTSPSGARVEHPVRLLVPWLAQHDSKKRTPHPSDMAFTYEDIGGTEGIARWLAVAARYRSMLGHIMNTRYVKTLVDAKFSFRVAALQGLHREWTGREPHFNTALIELAELAGAPFTRLVSDPIAWCEKVKNERNNVAHHAGRQIYRSSAELLYSSDAAYWLFVLCLMRLARFSDEAFDRTMSCPEFVWLAGRAGDASGGQVPESLTTP